MTRIAVFAPAKINLALHVLGRRADGFHLLDSLVAFADIGDELDVTASQVLRVDLAGPFADALNAADNSVTKAASFLAEAMGHTPNVHIHLTKNLPVASGIGGGSSDAAATLLACQRLWGVKDLPDAPRIAAHLGADVPVCLRRRPTHMSGIGEALTDAPALPDCAVVLANPGVAVPTSVVFKAFGDRFGQALPAMRPWHDVQDLARYLNNARNDLERPAITQAPMITLALDGLRAQPGCLMARMSGSGATCFGLFADAAAAETAARHLSQARPDWWIKAGRLRTAA